LSARAEEEEGGFGAGGTARLSGAPSAREGVCQWYWRGLPWPLGMRSCLRVFGFLNWMCSVKYYGAGDF